MECYMCKIEKLPNEFPPTTVTSECRHPMFYCMRCTLKNVEEKSECPQVDCKKTVSIDDPNPRLFKAILKKMFTEYDVTMVPDVVHPLTTGGSLTVTLMTGETIEVPYSSTLDILEVKRRIQQKLKHAVDKQKLLYNDVELMNYRADGQPAQLRDYNVPQNATIYLVIVLFTITENFNHVTFDLYWGYPSSGRDYLDATCLIFSASSGASSDPQICDYSRRKPNGFIYHSGDVMDDRRRIGHHTINVSMKNIPPNVTHLFFTLSAYTSTNIAKYPNPSLKFYESANPSKDLCKTTFTHAGHSQAVIMCSVSRDSSGKWQIFGSGKLSGGNAMGYDPLIATARSLIAQGF